MSTAPSHDDEDPEDLESDNAALAFAYAFGGVVIGFVAILFALLVEGLLVALAQTVTGKDTCADGFGTIGTVVLIAAGVLITLIVGRRLYGWRKYIGAKGDPADAEFAAMIRKRFTYGSMIVYCVMLPFSWVFIFAAANCAGMR